MWLRTFSGKRVDLIDPRPEQIDFEDIAVSLSRICRFNGHTPEFYSVLQHSIEVGNEFPSGDPARKYALLHDAHEAYTGDITTPIKQVLNSAYPALAELQHKFDKAIFEAAGLLFPMPADLRRKVFAADSRVLCRELTDVIGVNPEVYEIPDLQDFARHTRIVPAQDVAKLRVDWLQALELV